MSDSVPTVAQIERVDLKCGGHVMVKRISRTKFTDILEIVGDPPGGVREARVTNLTARVSVVSGDGLKDLLSGEEIKLKTEVHPVLGKIMGKLMLEALTKDEVEKIGDFAISWMAEQKSGN